MPHFLCRLNASRPSFPADMTEGEAALMERHAAYWASLVEPGKVVAFGPVLDPAGVWGMALVEVESDEEARALTAADPVILAATGFNYAIHAMPRTIVRSAPDGSRPA